MKIRFSERFARDIRENYDFRDVPAVAELAAGNSLPATALPGVLHDLQQGLSPAEENIAPLPVHVTFDDGTITIDERWPYSRAMVHALNDRMEWIAQQFGVKTGDIEGLIGAVEAAAEYKQDIMHIREWLGIPPGESVPDSLQSILDQLAHDRDKAEGNLAGLADDMQTKLAAAHQRAEGFRWLINKAQNVLMLQLMGQPRGLSDHDALSALHGIFDGPEWRAVAALTTEPDQQARVAEWVRTRFGESVLADLRERAARVLEEALELAQAEGLPRGDVLALAQHVYSKEPGEPQQEAAGVGVTLKAYAAAKGFQQHAAVEQEIRRIESMPADHFRQRQQAKADAGVALKPQPTLGTEGAPAR